MTENKELNIERSTDIQTHTDQQSTAEDQASTDLQSTAGNTTDTAQQRNVENQTSTNQQSTAEDQASTDLQSTAGNTTDTAQQRNVENQTSTNQQSTAGNQASTGIQRIAEYQNADKKSCIDIESTINGKSKKSTDIEIEEGYERALLVGVNLGQDEEEFARSMEELKNLAKACLQKPVGVVTQNMDSVHKALYIGSGKVQEVKQAAISLQAEVIVFEDALTPAQLDNLQKELDLPVLDRTALILDIFAKRARSREAKLQVEVARLTYLLPRLTGMHKALTRQGGTSGSMSSRGVGEKKLELDRRKIEKRITKLNRDLKEVSAERDIQRKKREKSTIPLVALVGYTNAGKSTILNAMIDRYMQDAEKKVLEKDLLFATLDTTVRRICTGNNQDFLLSDTVGFIHKLPHGLVKAFRATLEEIANADLLLHVVDCADPGHKEQMQTTEETLVNLHAADIPMITVYNKADLAQDTVYPRVAGENKIYISAKEPSSLELLVNTICKQIYADYVQTEFLIPYVHGDALSYLTKECQVLYRTFEENGTRMKVRCRQADREKYKDFVIL